MEAGLCQTCEHCRAVQSSRGSRFYLCLLSETDPKYAKYPRLPVLKCEGYHAAREGNDARNDQADPASLFIDEAEALC